MRKATAESATSTLFVDGGRPGLARQLVLGTRSARATDRADLLSLVEQVAGRQSGRAGVGDVPQLGLPPAGPFGRIQGFIRGLDQVAGAEGVRIILPARTGVIEAGDSDAHAHVVCGLRVLMEDAERRDFVDNLLSHVLGAVARRL